MSFGGGWLSSSGGESSGAVEVSLGTVSTGVVADSGGTADVSFALPSGVTSFLITRIVIERTAGTGTSAGVTAYTKDDRSDNARSLLGDDFSQVGVTIDPGPVYGPDVEISAVRIYPSISYTNVDGSEFVRLRCTNRDFSNSATYDITLHGIPLG